MRVLAAATLLLALAFDQAQRPPVFRSRTDLVEWSVSVLDQEGRPVRRLSAAAFRVFEDDLERPVHALAEVEVPEAVPAAAAWLRGAPTDVETNDVGDKRLIVIIMDDASYGQERMAMQARELGRSVVDRLGPADLAAVVFTGANARNAQGFTADKGRLLRAIDGTTWIRMPTSVGVRATRYLSGTRSPRSCVPLAT